MILLLHWLTYSNNYFPFEVWSVIVRLLVTLAVARVI